MVIVKLPDGSELKVNSPASPSDAAKEISMGLYNACIAAKVNGELVDLNRKFEKDFNLELLKENAPEAKDILLHSVAHIMAQAVKELFPETKITIGPAIEDGFYYDFDKEPAFAEADLEKIEKKMQEIIDEDLPFERKVWTREEAIEFFSKDGETYKVEIASDLDDTAVVTAYTQGSFTDLCRGPHLPSTGKVKAFKLLKTAGAYWRGDSSNKMLSRIYGTAFFSKKELNSYLHLLEEAKKRDHRKLGKQLDLFEINEKVGPGLVLWHPKGAELLNTIRTYWMDTHRAHGYKFVQTPHVGRANLWETSGHLSFYKDGMFDSMEVEGDQYYVKPMNCPFHVMIYNSQGRSYRELPIKYAELGTVYRYEMSGTLHGLMRVRGFTQDDAHIICTPEQLNEEVEKLIQFAFDFLKSFGFTDYEVYVSTRNEEKYVGEIDKWNQAENALKSALEHVGVPYQVDQGEATFYGPKIDMKIKDAIGRMWQCTTIQFDFNLSERFNMEYTDKDGLKKQPYMIHRAILGSLERFVGILIENTVGDFPLWLAPVQAMVIPVTDNHKEFAENFLNTLIKEGFRAEINLKSEPIGAKIRSAELDKIPTMFIIGDKEIESGSVSVRTRKDGNKGAVKIAEALNMMQEEIKNKG
ncbi:MAG: threonine--tRNA ligase [Candidatus Marinimicrobia bacterium]|nr:threonine--tRNA ligase [Candidatus Neomarinimicrobiota bacterium]